MISFRSTTGQPLADDNSLPIRPQESTHSKRNNTTHTYIYELIENDLKYPVK